MVDHLSQDFPIDAGGRPAAVLYGVTTDGITDTFQHVDVTSSGEIETTLVGSSITQLPPISLSPGSSIAVTQSTSPWVTSLTGSSITQMPTTSIDQDVVASIINSSSSNLSAGATFTGLAESTLGIVGIQVSLKTDQNCTVYVDQSPDGTNWDIVDTYNYYQSINNFGVTVQAVNSYVRVRVKNLNASTATTYFRLQTALCPIVEALPRSLNEDGHLKVASYRTEDQYGFNVENTPTGEERAISPVRLVGATFDGLTLDTNFWTASTGTGGSATMGSAQVILSTGTTANNPTSLQSVRNARYVGAAANRFRTVMRLPDTGTDKNTRRWGAFNTTSGAFFELNGTTNFRTVTRKAGLDTQVINGGFNGVYGNTYALDTNVHTWEIYWTNSKVWFVAGDQLLHTMTANTTTWSDSMNLPIRYESVNSDGGAADVALNVRVGSISRLGQLVTQPISKYQSGTTAAGGVICKLGVGNLHKVIISSIATSGAVITLYDGATTAGSVIHSWTVSFPVQGNYNPATFDFGGLPFYTGLILTVTTQNANVTVIYE